MRSCETHLLLDELLGDTVAGREQGLRVMGERKGERRRRVRRR
jgi:hypothetical protein